MLLLSALVVSAAAAQHAPAFFWSPTAMDLEMREHEFLREATSADLEQTIAAVVGESPAPSVKGSALFAGRPAKAPEIQLVFLADGLTTEAVRAHGSKLQALQSLMQKSAASMTAPFTIPTPQKRAFDDAKARIAGADVEEYLRVNAQMYANGAAETVVVELVAADGADAAETLAAHDETIGKVARAVHAGTNGNYAALLTGAHGQIGARRQLVGEQLAPAHVLLSGGSYLYTTPTLLTAYMISLMLFIIFISGFCCLFSLQTPKSFEELKSA